MLEKIVIETFANNDNNSLNYESSIQVYNFSKHQISLGACFFSAIYFQEIWVLKLNVQMGSEFIEIILTLFFREKGQVDQRLLADFLLKVVQGNLQNRQ